MKAKAILTTNNAYDTILLDNGTTMTVTHELFKDFISSEPEIDFWQGVEYWEEHGDTVEEAAEAYGETVAYYDDDNNFVIVDKELWQNRYDFYIQEDEEETLGKF